jgi:hypothetical protein
MKNLLVIVSVLFLFLLSSCAHHVEVTQCIQNQEIFGFWGGLWHGIISPFSLLSMLWSDNVVFAVNNNGGWYTFGFCLGSGILGSLPKIIFVARRN